MFDYIVICTIGGNTSRFDKRHVENFDKLSNEKELEEVLKTQTLTIELKTRKIKFLTRNIEKVEIVQETKEVV
ncbi:hypothetical protein ACQPUY_15460 [Clostridium nigeriense]|uniref:hypothetical protein n=1 Tax=Clostridium nigeriense TaxID=1805470 RepID=UPI003D32E72B